MILVTGAAGKTGRAVTAALAARGAAVRALVRRPSAAPLLEAASAREVIVGDLEHEPDLVTACTGVTAIYHICPNLHPAEVEIARLLMNCAGATGVRRLVYHSVLHPQTEAMPHHWRKLRVEELIFTGALDWTILQPTAYFQNLLAYWPAIAATGVYAPPYAPATRLGMVDLEDVAEVAARVLNEPGHSGAIYELAGTEVFTQVQVADVFAAELSRPVRAEAADRSVWARQAAAQGMDVDAIDVLLRMFTYYEQHGLWGNSFVLTHLLGRAPCSLREFVRRTLRLQQG